MWQPIETAPEGDDLFLAWSPENEESSEGFGLVYRRGNFLYEPSLEEDKDHELPLDFYRYWIAIPEAPHVQ